MPSFQSKLFNGFLSWINIKPLINKLARRRKRSAGSFFSRAERKKYRISTKSIDGMDVSVMGWDLEKPVHVIYFHGGMYALAANNGHKRWLFQLFEKADCKITFVDYPLAPESTVIDTINKVVHVYQDLAERFPEDDFVLMGDSSGGGLALVLAQHLRDQYFGRRPRKMILYSPWVRLDMQNSAIKACVDNDIILDRDVLYESALAYAGGFDLTHPHLSPYFASCVDLGDMHIFYGSEEMLAPDIRLLEEKCSEEEVPSAFHCYPGMQHVFHLFTFLPESKAVLKETIRILEDNLRLSV